MSRTSRKPVWEDDSKVKRCPKCRTEFGWTSRKHHCRACGKVFCNKCSTHTLTIPRYVRFYGNEPVRVCDTCFYKEKHEMMKQQRDAGAKKFSVEQKKVSPTINDILSPVSVSKNVSTTPQTEKSPIAVPEPVTPDSPPKEPSQPSTVKSDKNQSFYALPPSVRKTKISNSVVSSIFGDDLFGSPAKPKPQPKQPKVQPTVATNTNNPKKDAPNFEMQEEFPKGPAPETESDIFGTKTTIQQQPTIKPTIKPASNDDDDIPQPEPFPVNILNTKPTQPERKDPVPQIPEQKEVAPIPVVQPVIPVQEKIPEPAPIVTPTPDPSPVVSAPDPVPARPTNAVSIDSLPSPYDENLFIPPRDGGMGETPKARVMQEKLFFRFVNAYLGQRGMSMSAFDPEFLNGVLFIMLVETVSHTPLPDSLSSQCKVNPQTREDYHCNFHFAIQHLKEIGKPLPVLSIKGVLDGDIGCILDLIW
eukprot:CAMPEP_0117011734 /NCGR_PEP_ID=MMETSP0472-20121206/10029_1 /TAXON_ID=693140 ORGANISM="Tiarina fusus, Strain LIS" /NCGR_SAMPLE_ID=MMETSP0472 /ASSEMBLY_ACC=CAM_ASM_000603 /LENGTH=472 /DNA_ID=CAMNT_0004714629 /DNA_START=29 /DNA_END=1444 /DNA_ORIENTATION=+